MRPLLLVLGALGAAGLLVWGVARGIDVAGELSSARIGETRTAIPGKRDAVLDSGRYTVFYEVDERSGGPDEIDVPPVDVAIRSEGDGPRLELEGFSGDLDIASGGRAATAIASVKLPDDGRYRIRASGREEARAPAIVLGRPIGGRVLRLLLAVAAVVAGVGLAALVAVTAIALRAREGRAADL